MPYCTITTISESPLKPGTIWVGTDDGRVQLTQNHGGAWTDITPALTTAGAPADRWVSRVFASPHDAGTAFVSKTGFRNDDFAPYLYKTTDSGKTWTAIQGRGGAPAVAPLTVGDYAVTVDVAGQSLTKPARVRARIASAGL